MSSPVLTVAPETPGRDAVQLMLGNHVSGLPVVDARGHLVGVITEADLLLKEVEPKPPTPVVEWAGPWLWFERWVGAHRQAEGGTVGEVMTHHVVTADEETPVHELAARMVRHQINRLPIVRGREVVGIVTRADILKGFLRSDEDLAAGAARPAGPSRAARRPAGAGGAHRRPDRYRRRRPGARLPGARAHRGMIGAT